MNTRLKPTDINFITFEKDGLAIYKPAFLPDQTFTRSNGTTISRLYERLTKASRRRSSPNATPVAKVAEKAYRQGVYDAYKALQEELS